MSFVAVVDRANALATDPLVVSGLKKQYGQTIALAGVSFRIPSNSVVAILGPNGAGKSTLLEIISGLRSADSGEATLFGVDILKHPRACQERIGVQLQDTRLNPKITIDESIKLFASFYEKLGDVEEIMKTLGLEANRKKRVGSLSGGWHQRLSLALALINDPDLLILDEPTTGFDPLIRREVWKILEDLRSTGRSIIISTHYMEEAERLADHIILLSKGSIIAAGTSAELKAAFADTGATLEDVYANLIQRDEVMS